MYMTYVLSFCPYQEHVVCKSNEGWNANSSIFLVCICIVFWSTEDRCSKPFWMGSKKTMLFSAHAVYFGSIIWNENTACKCGTWTDTYSWRVFFPYWAKRSHFWWDGLKTNYAGEYECKLTVPMHPLLWMQLLLSKLNYYETIYFSIIIIIFHPSSKKLKRGLHCILIPLLSSQQPC